MNKNRKYAIGIDLGTSTSEIAIYRDNTVELIPAIDSPTKSVIIPSVVARSISNLNEIIIGERALAYLKNINLSVQEIKRKMGQGDKVKLGDSEYLPQEISAFILKKLQYYAKEYTGEDIKDVVISVPANFKDAARQATKDAAELAGLNVLRLINEPTAAALAYGFGNIKNEGKIIVFDFGGGTLDVTILEMMEGVLDVIASHGDPQLGGKDIDECFSEYILSKFLKSKNISSNEISIENNDKQRLKIEAEKTKKILSSQESVEFNLLGFAKYSGDILDIEGLQITRTEFDESIRHILQKALNCVKESLKLANLKHENIQEVVLVGGSTYIPAVRDMMEHEFKRKIPHGHISPDEAVARGAAIQAAIASDLLNMTDSIIISDVSPFTLNTEIAIERGNQLFLVLDPLIMKNTKIPFSIEKDYALLSTRQSQLDLKLFQGDGKLSEECELVASGQISQIPESKNDDPHKVIVSFSYDINGIVDLTAKIENTDRILKIEYKQSSNRIDTADKNKYIDKIDSTFSSSSVSYEDLIKNAENLLKRVTHTDDNQLLKNGIEAMKKAIAEGNNNIIQSAEVSLTDVLIDLGLKY